jgi:hypothetical protein
MYTKLNLFILKKQKQKQKQQNEQRTDNNEAIT